MSDLDFKSDHNRLFFYYWLNINPGIIFLAEMSVLTLKFVLPKNFIMFLSENFLH